MRCILNSKNLSYIISYYGLSIDSIRRTRQMCNNVRFNKILFLKRFWYIGFCFWYFRSLKFRQIPCYTVRIFFVSPKNAFYELNVISTSYDAYIHSSRSYMNLKFRSSESELHIHCILYSYSCIVQIA